MPRVAIGAGPLRNPIADTALRDSLTFLAILLIGILTAALVGPHLVDWDSHRAFIERKLSEAAGTPVRVAGAIDLKLLPTPVFSLGRVAIGDGAAGRSRLSAEELDAELSLTALMRGDVKIVDTALVRPHLDLTQAPDGGFDLAPPWGDATDRVSVDHIGIRDGSVGLVLGDGRRLSFAGLELDGEATSLRGPFKATGRLGAVPFRVATGAIDRGRLRVKLHLDGAGLRPALDLDGTMAGRPGPAGPGFEGSATLAGQLPLDGTPATVPWRMTGRLSADRDAATASDVELRAGADLRALIAGGEATAAFAATPSMPSAMLRLHGATLDLDALAVAPPGGDIAPPDGAGVMRSLLRLVDDGAGPTGLPLHVAASTDFDTATLSGQTLLGLRGRFALGPEPSVGLSLSAGGPAETRFALDGAVEPAPARPVAGPFGAAPARGSPVFRGRAEAHSSDLRRAVAWLRPMVPGMVDWSPAAVGVRSVTATADVEASAAGVSGRGVKLDIDGSTFAGTLSFAPAVGAAPARIAADLSSSALALERLPDPSEAASAARDLDFDLALAADAVSLAHPPGPGASPQTSAALTARHVAMRVTKASDALKLERLSLDLDGVKIDATASRIGPKAEAEVLIDAPQLLPLAQAVAGVLPAAAGPWMRLRAAALSPAHLTFHVDAGASADGGLLPSGSTLAGTAGPLRIDAALTSDAGAAGVDAARRPVSVSLKASAPDTSALLRRFGVVPAAPALDAVQIALRGRGSWERGLDGDLLATVGTTSLAYAGHAGLADGRGRLTLRSPDAQPILAVLGLAPPGAGLAAAVAADLAWDGVAVSGTRIVATLGDATLGGTLAYDGASRRSGAADPTIHGHLTVDRLAAGGLLALALGAPTDVVPPAIWSTRPFAAPASGLPRGDISLDIASLSLGRSLGARAVALTLKTGGGVLELSDVAGTLEGGTVGGGLTLRRDGPLATLSGHVGWAGIPFDIGGLAGRSGGTQDLAGTGETPAALVASLGGAGTLDLSGATLAETDPAAPNRTVAVFAARDAVAERGGGASDPTPTDPAAIRREFVAELGRGASSFGDAKVATTLAGGIWRTAPFLARGVVQATAGQGGAPSSVETSATIDLDAWRAATRTALHSPGTADSIVMRAGPLGGPAQIDVDATGVVGAVQAAAIARAQERIDVMEQDIRERAAFNRQLKAWEAERQAARDRAEADRQAALARAVADAQAKALAALQAAAAARAEAQAAADARTAAAEARAAAAEARRIDQARQRAEDARVQAQVEAAARAERSARDAAEKQKFIDRVLKAPDPPLDLGAADAPLTAPRRQDRGVPSTGRDDPLNPAPPPSILQDP